MTLVSDPFRFNSPALQAPARVVRFSGREAVNQLYRFDVRLLVARHEASSFLERAIGERATLTLVVDGDRGRAVHGIITAAGVLERFDGERFVAEVQLAPKLTRLTLKRASRVFIERSAREIVAEMLDRDGIRHRFSLRKEPQRREMCVQYAEADYAFVSRLLAEEGMFTFFEHPADAAKAEEVLVIGDDPSGYIPIGEPAELRFRRAAPEGGMVLDEDVITSFTSSRRLRPQAMLQRTFDMSRPHVELGVARALQGMPRLESPGTMRALVDRDLTISEHFGPREDALVHPHDSARSLEAERRGASEASGESPSRRLLPGAVFTLTEHDVPELDRAYVVTESHHEGLGAISDERNHPVYTNRFRCEPADFAVRPPRPASRVVQALETATVMGPPGQDVFTDELGRVKLRFHWDLDEKVDEKRSCWARVGQPWAGAGWGAQFIPRVGSEVLVGFMGGDPDRPVVLAGVYNGTNPIPFGKDLAGGVSGILSRGLGDGKVGHEICWDDRPGAQRLSLRAQGLMTAEAADDMRLDAGSTLAVRAAASRTDEVGDAFSVTVGGAHHRSVAGAETSRIGGDHHLRVAGKARTEIAGGLTSIVGGPVLERIGADRTTFIGSAGGHASDATAVNGEYRVAASSGITLVSNESVQLRVGSSSIQIGPDRILIEAEDIVVQAKRKLAAVQGEETASASLVLEGSASLAGGELFASSSGGAKLHLDADAHLDGALVKLNCGSGPAGAAQLLAHQQDAGTAVIRLERRFLEGAGPFTLVIQMPDGSLKEHPIEAGGELVLHGRPGDKFLIVELRDGDNRVPVGRQET